MDFLADESCPAPVIRALRADGHDVLAVGDVVRGAGNEAVLRLAFDQGRVLVTEDRDFGELVFAHCQPSTGVILIRFPHGARGAKPAAAAEAVRRLWPGVTSDAGRCAAHCVVLGRPAVVTYIPVRC